jgi:enoyl-CoA hydratase/carnithine racemase
MADKSPAIERRTVLKGAMVMAGMATVAQNVTPAAAQPASQPGGRLADAPLAPGTRATVERRGQIVLIGINRPDVYNRMDPEGSRALAVALTGYDHDDSLRCAILFGHGDNFSRGIDVDAHKAAIGQAPATDDSNLISLTGDNPKRRLSKPLIVVVHGDTWNAAHEMFLACDIRVCSADVRFGQDEVSHARFPGGGGTIRFVREVGWGNAMRYILTGDHWGAQEAYRMGEVQEIAPTKDAALEVAVKIANKVAGCGPLGIKTALVSAHTALDSGEPAAFAQLGKQYNGLYATRDFQEGRDAEAQNRPPVYIGQ